MKNIERGKKGENLALKYLEDLGYTIIDKNWRYSRCGEIDIIALDHNTLAFIEVKARSSLAFGDPAEAINSKKMERMRSLAGIYTNENKTIGYKEMRIDLIAIILGKEPQITHYKDI